MKSLPVQRVTAHEDRGEVAQCLCGIVVIVERGAVPCATHALDTLVSEDTDYGVGGELVGKVVGPGKALDLGGDNSDFNSFYFHGVAPER